MNKSPLRSVLADKAVMDEIRNSNETLEAARTSLGNESLDVLLTGNEVALREGGYTQTEAIILLKGRPALIIQDGIWENPKSAEIIARLAPAEAFIKDTIPKVGRVEILNFSMDYIGTGWMVDEGILITNRHVAELFGQKRGNLFSFRASPEGDLYQVRVDFKREYQRSDIAQAAVKDIIFIDENSELRPDMALVILDKASGVLPSPIELDTRVPDFQNNIAVIGYPAEDPRNDAFAMRDIFKGVYNVKRLSPGRVSGIRPDGKLLEHDCTTLGGNSGSVVINLETKKACGLHFSGTYRDRNFAVTSLWIKSRLAELTPNRIIIPSTFQGEADASVTPEQEGRPDVTSGRKGYLSTFLGDSDFEVPLPKIDQSLQAKKASVSGDQNAELKYTHFSICMRSDRRLPFFTACNINGGLLFNFPRSADRWFLDPRLDKDNQIDDVLYSSNPLDRGHLVRRLDPAWGETREEAKMAEEDTFFFTNCTPQHSKLNQKIWLSLEDYVLSNAATHDLKVTVFTGPIMNDEKDRIYRGIQIPEEFWKIAVIVNSFTRQLSATGYILSQADYLGDLEFVYGEFKTYQVPISQIEEKTKLSFDLSGFDPLSNTEARPQREIRNAIDLIL